MAWGADLRTLEGVLCALVEDRVCRGLVNQVSDQGRGDRSGSEMKGEGRSIHRDLVDGEWTEGARNI